MLTKNRINNFFCGLGMLGLLLFGTGAWAGPLHSVMLSVPDHAEEALTWCGPATAQMIMEGYPSGACSVLQEDIWTTIQTYKAESMWDTDAAGMRGALAHLCPPAATWIVEATANAQELMYNAAYWMSRLNYPVAGLLNTLPHNSYAAHAEHWVAIKGIVTDADPVTNPTVNLVFVWFIDPAVALGDPAIERFIAGSTWYTEFQPVTKPTSSYAGKYVAVIEPPQMRGKAIAPAEMLKGNLITPEKAVEYAVRWIEEYKLYEKGPYKLLKQSKPLSPLLVNKEYGGYYIVPFAEGRESRAGAAILINAYTGGFQEAGVFKSRSFISEKEARSIAIGKIKVRQPEKVSAEMMLPMKERAVSRYFPLWKVVVDGRTVGVTQQGQILTTIPR